MSDVDPSETVTTASDGVTVEKSFEPDDFPVPAIAFDLRSTRDTAVSVRLVDAVPDDVGPEDIGFHPKYGAEFWDADGDRIVFEREIAPEESYTTVYGLRGDDAAVATKFLNEPRLETVAPGVGSGGDASVPSGPGVDPADEPELCDGSGETGGSVPEPDDPDSDSGSVDGPGAVGRDEIGGERDGSAGSPGPLETGGRDPDRSRGTAAPTADADADGGLLGALASELEDADPKNPDVATIRSALGVESSASVETRIEHLQSTVADLEAYTDALEGFIDEHGDASEVLVDLRERHDETVDRIDEVETATEDATAEIEATEDHLEAELEAVRGDVRAVRADVEALEAEVATLSSDLEAVLGMRDRLANALEVTADRSASEGATDVADDIDDADRDA
jgi:outer membrane murein-binding lipoprotein Lpp